MHSNVPDIRKLAEMSGCGLQACANAIKICKGRKCRDSLLVREDAAVALEYLKLKGQPLARYKILPDGTKAAWTDEDYVAEAEKRVKATLYPEE